MHFYHDWRQTNKKNQMATEGTEEKKTVNKTFRLCQKVNATQKTERRRERESSGCESTTTSLHVMRLVGPANITAIATTTHTTTNYNNVLTANIFFSRIAFGWFFVKMIIIVQHISMKIVFSLFSAPDIVHFIASFLLSSIRDRNGEC